MSHWIPLFLLIAVAMIVSHYQQQDPPLHNGDSHHAAQILTVDEFRIEAASLSPAAGSATQRIVRPEISAGENTVSTPAPAAALQMPAAPQHPIGGSVQVEEARPVWPLEPLPEKSNTAEN